MVVWGGFGNANYVGTGGRYDPTTDSWTETNQSGAPGAREYHSAVWSEGEMIVWGGANGSILNSGGRYNPDGDSWTATDTNGAPPASYFHTAVWTRSGMIVWGGFLNGGMGNTGGVYCACLPVTWYRDADADGFGDLSVSTVACQGQPPAGYVSNNTDCNDANPSIHPGALELCNGVDDNCSGQTDDGLDVGAACTAGTGDCARMGVKVCTTDGIGTVCDAVPGTPTTFYRDSDGDGYGDSANTAVQCSTPAGYVTNAGDCNDANPAVHPGAAEVCNGIDDNCNGQVDEDASGVDSDGDGVHNACDNCRFAYNPSQLDVDHDGMGNSCDNCQLVPNPDQADTDGDQLGNVCDNCPREFNSGQSDFDGDRVGDACDNCFFDYNPDQRDFDHDGEGDICDLNDGQILILYVDGPDYIEWQQEAGFTSWNVYEGDLDVLKGTGFYTQAPGSNPMAQRHCGETATYVDDFDQPPAGKGVFSLVTGIANGVEGSLGQDSRGVERPNANPCP